MFKVFECFAGIGSQKKALEIISNKRKKETGKKFEYEVVGVSEWDVKAIQAYARIHHNKEYKKLLKKNRSKEELLKVINDNSLVFSNDGENVMKKETLLKKKQDWLNLVVSASEIINNKGSIMDIRGEQITQLGVNFLTYSFPCQDLSSGSQFTKKKTGLEGKRSGLLYQIERILSEQKQSDQPEFLMLENVYELIRNPIFNKMYQEWLKKLESWGYKTQTFMLNSKDFGIPQTRKRVFAISSKLPMNEVTKEDLINSYNNNHKNRTKKLSQIIMRDKHFVEQIMSAVKPTPSRLRMYHKVPKLIDERTTFTNTLTKKQDRTPNPGTVRITEIENVLNKINEYREDFLGYEPWFRFLTPRETFLLTGFDSKDFDKASECGFGVRPYYAMAGNSIVTNVMLPLFDEVIKVWEK